MQQYAQKDSLLFVMELEDGQLKVLILQNIHEHWQLILQKYLKIEVQCRRKVEIKLLTIQRNFFAKQ